MKCKPKIQKSMVYNRKGNGGETESRENIYQFLILEISMECHKYKLINEILIRILVLISVVKLWFTTMFYVSFILWQKV